MIAKPADLRSERGFVLATVLVLLLVLTLSAFTGAMLTRTDIQLVNNEQNEKQAFYYAEAGISEALLRLNLKSATNVVIDGNTFDGSFTGQYAPNQSQTDWQAQILLSGATATQLNTSTHVVTTPTLQAAASHLPYSTTIRWDLSGGAIRRIGGSNVLEIVSTGQSGTARRTITERVVFNNLSAVILGCDTNGGNNPTNNGIDAQGSGTVRFTGGVQVNCAGSQAVHTGGSAGIWAGGSITVTGGYSGNVSPMPTTGSPQLPDPLASLAAPQPTGRPQRTATGNTLNPGIYAGGINLTSGTTTLNPGVYVMAGGGFHITSNATVIGNGVMIYNSCAAYATGCTTFGTNDFVEIKSNRQVTLTAPDSSGAEPAYAGIVAFQDRLNTRALQINASATGNVDGLIYAKSATVTMQGGSQLIYSQFVVQALTLGGGPQIGQPTNWVPIGGGSGVKVISWQDF